MFVDSFENKKMYDPNSSKIILSFMSVQFLGFFYFNGFRVIFPLILGNMGYNEIQVYADWALIYGLGLFISGLTRYPMGIVADKLSRKWLLTLCALLIGISIVGIGLTNNVILLAISFGIMRTGNHLAPLITRGFINETDRSRQGTINSYGTLISNVGGMVGPILFALFLDISFVSLIILSNIILLVFYAFFMLRIPAKQIKNTIPIGTFIKTSINELSKFKMVILLYIIIGTINGIINYLQLPYGVYVLHLSGNYVSFLIGIMTLLTTGFIPFAGKLTDRIGTQLTTYIGMIIIIGGSLFQILDQSSVVYYFLCQLLINGGILLGINSLVTYITLNSKNATTSSIFGGTTSFYFLGSSFLPLANVFIPGVSVLLYSLDPLIPFYLIIVISVIIFPIAYVSSRINRPIPKYLG